MKSVQGRGVQQGDPDSVQRARRVEHLELQRLTSHAKQRTALIRIRGGAPRQLKVFDALDRDERGRVLSVAHVDVVLADRLSAPGLSWTLAPVVGERAQLPGRQRRLPYDHDLIVAEAVAWVRSEHRRGPDPFGLSAPEFTLSDLQRLHEAVAGERLVKDTFRRGVLPALAPTGQERLGSIGRPAALYRRRGAPPNRPTEGG